jgi:hypothetical protein
MNMKKTAFETKEVLICECNSDEHQYLIYYSEDEFLDGQKIPMVYIHPHLITYNSFWKRALYGIKYIFGYKTKYGAWDEFMVNPSDADKIQEIVNYLKRDKND